VKIGLIVPVMKNFKGFTQLMRSVDVPVLPLVQDNWTYNHGVSVAWNNGLSEAINNKCDYALVVNDDVVLRRGLIDTLIRHVDDYNVTVSPTNETGLCHPRGLNFWCFALEPRKFVARFGYFDEKFSPAYFEDDDMAYRIRLGGGNPLTIPQTAYHQVMGTQAMDDKVVVGAGIWDRNHAYYEKKWGGPGGQERFTHPFNDETKTIKDW
jgi:GT2 family glycosyltransferase